MLVAFWNGLMIYCFWTRRTGTSRAFRSRQVKSGHGVGRRQCRENCKIIKKLGCKGETPGSLLSGGNFSLRVVMEEKLT
ncbi:hypothetical protein E2C01_002857 [Portunus trituberculatus]|uniref:Uncharacterized protein n=1 Tax=Portunus trituberculatus TaxID=210409 RepID=A0A5B7CLV3_PORTR|nr:hypothetical protein [Portunus trituberculatus]